MVINADRVLEKTSRARHSCPPEVKEGRVGVRAAERWGEGRKSNSGQENVGTNWMYCKITTEEGCEMRSPRHGPGLRALLDLLKILDFIPKLMGSR